MMPFNIVHIILYLYELAVLCFYEPTRFLVKRNQSLNVRLFITRYSQALQWLASKVRLGQKT